MLERALILNVGSSSLKWSVLASANEAEIAADHLAWTASSSASELQSILAKAGKVDAVGHRVVHGGARFTGPVVVDDSVRAALGELVSLDPIHTPVSLAALDAARVAFPEVPHVVAFDTAFHSTIPEVARLYAVPRRWQDELGVRRYGFHGLSVEHAVRRTSELLGAMPGRLVVCHLGSGSSLTAVREGHSVDTTMGMTPLEGVVMGTRSGSIDPGVVVYAMKRLGLDGSAVDHALNREAGLLALSGVSDDLREIRRAAEGGSAQAELALGVLLVSLRRALGAMVATLGGVDAVTFTGGIGENDTALRGDVLACLAFAGASVNPEKNQAKTVDRRIEKTGSSISALVVCAREDLSILRAMRSLLG